MNLDQLIDHATEQQLRTALRAAIADINRWKNIVGPDSIYGIGVDEAVTSIADIVKKEIS